MSSVDDPALYVNPEQCRHGAKLPNLGMLDRHAADSSIIAAQEYVRRGWAPIPIAFREKRPAIPHWPDLRLTEADLPQYFGVEPKNIGILLGDPSNGLVDIDLDHFRAVALADQFLPPTGAIFGRGGKLRSHRLYRVASSVRSRQFRSKSAGMIVELRSTGLQTVFPPSVHPSGELIQWGSGDRTPVPVDPAMLVGCIEALADCVRAELGESTALVAAKTGAPSSDHSAESLSDSSAASAACIADMMRIGIADQNDGSRRLLTAACRVVEHDLCDMDGIAAIRCYAQTRPFPETWSDEEIVTRIRDAEARTKRGSRRAVFRSSRPSIIIGADEHRVVTETIAALTSDLEIYQRGGMLVRVVRGAQLNDGLRRCAGSATISAIPIANLRERITQFAELGRFSSKRDSNVPVHPPAWLATSVHARGDWPSIRHLAGVSEVPIVRADGTVWQTPGYDDQTGILYHPTGELPPIPDITSADVVESALRALYEAVCDFPFATSSDAAAWLSALLTPLARAAFDGPAPLFLINANVAGLGKSLLAQIIGLIVLGREMAVSSYSSDPDEMRKKITSIALAGDTVVHLDNLTGNVGNEALDRALTSTRWKDRILATNNQVDLPLRVTWFATGNNVTVAADTGRRIVPIQLDLLCERPENRADFVHANLFQWIHERRPQLLIHALTILAAYCRAGRPQQNLTPLGSFEGWSGFVRSAVVWLGFADPCGGQSRMIDSTDETVDALGQLLAVWQDVDPQNDGLILAQLLEKLYHREHPPRDTASIAMRAAIECLVGRTTDRVPTAASFGARLRAHKRRVLGGLYLDSAGKTRDGQRWRLFRAGQDAKA